MACLLVLRQVADDIFEQRHRVQLIDPSALARGFALVIFAGLAVVLRAPRIVPRPRNLLSLLALLTPQRIRVLAIRALARESVHVPIDDMGMCEAVHGVVFHAAMCFLRERLANG